MALLATSRYDPNEMVEGVLRVLLPDLDQGISESVVLLGGFG